MCKFYGKAKRVKRPMTVYKYAPSGDRSEFDPHQRSHIQGYKTAGETLYYGRGQATNSPSGPGIMAYVLKPPSSIYTCEWLVLRIPRGAWIRRGEHGGNEIIAASRVITLRRLNEAES